VSRFYRLISKNIAPFPSALLYFPVKEGGLGFKRLSNVIQLSKLTLMGRLITVGGSAGKAMESMVLRGFRSAGQFFPPNGRATMAKSLGPCTWVTSLSDWLSEIGIGINKPGVPEAVGNPSIALLVGEADIDRGVGCLAEVHMVGDESPSVEGLEWMGTYSPAPRACIPIRVGQVWSFANRIGRLYEIIGFLGESQLCYVTWRSLTNLEDPICIGTQVHIDEPNFCNGAGGGSSMDIDIFLHGLGGEASLVFLSEEKHKASGVTCFRVLGSRTRHPSHDTTPIVSHLWSRLVQMSSPASQIYTDGSRASHADVGDFYAGVNTS